MHKILIATLLAIHVNAISMNTQSHQELQRVTDPTEIATAGYPIEAFSQNSYPCIFKLGNAFFDFTPFKLARNVWPAYYVNETQVLPDPLNPDPLFVSSLVQSYQYEVGFCTLMNEANNATCPTTQAYAIGSTFDALQAQVDGTVENQPPTDCLPQSGDNSKSIKAVTISKEISTDDGNGTITNTTVTGVAITYSGGICNSTGGPSTFTIKSWCNQSLAIADTEYSGFANITGDDFCNPYIEITSQLGGCDLFQNSIIWEYLDYAKPYFGAAGIAVGAVLCFFGFKLLKPSICFGGFLSCTMLSLLIFYSVYITSIDQLATFYYWMAGGAAVGLIIGAILAKFVKVGAAVLAAWGGFALGLILNEAVMYRFEYSWVFWTTNGICMLVCAALTFKMFNQIIVGTTSLLGAYLLARGVSCYLGHYYNEFTIINMLKSGTIDQVDPYYWGYVGGFAAFTAIGAWYQWTRLPKAKPAHPYHH